MFRRGLVLFTLLSALAPAALAARVDVVKIMSFSCSVCAASEAIDATLSDAVSQTGGRYVSAPVPTVEGRTGLLENIYYAGRNIDPRFGVALKRSFYRAVQEKGLTLDTENAILVWLQKDLPDFEQYFDATFANAKTKAGSASLIKALRIVEQVGAVDTPTYVVLVNGEIKESITVVENKGSIVNTRATLLSKINSYAKEK